MRAGVYNAGTGVWTNGATYNVTRDGNDFKVTGTLPYGDADVIFATAGNRWAVRISKDGITAKSQLPSGTIVKATNTEVEGGYSTGTKSDFEDDGSLIMYGKVDSETLSAYKREVKIKWVAGGEFTIYTFDLSGATLGV